MQKYINGFQTTLVLSLTDLATTATITDASALVLGAGEFYIATLQSATGKEIIKITAVAGSELTIERGLEGTTATAFAIGDRCEIRVTASGLDGFLQRTEVLDEDDFTSDSPTLPPSQQSVSAYIANLNPFTLQGGLDGSIPDQLPAANAGDTYKITVAGTVSGVAVQSGDTAICTVDGTAANTPANWIFGQGNIEQATTAEAKAGTEDTKYLTPAMGRIMARSMLGVAFVKMMATDDEQDLLLWLKFNGNGDQTVGQTGSGADFADNKYYDLYHAIQNKFDKPNDGCVGVFNWADDGVVYLPRMDGMAAIGASVPGEEQTLNGRLKEGWTLGAYTEDQSQAWQIGATEDLSGARNYWAITGERDFRASKTNNINQTVPRLTTTGQGDPLMIKAVSDGTNGAPRVGTQASINSISFHFYILY